LLPFVDDRLRQLLKEKVMSNHQPIIPTITTILLNVDLYKEIKP
jgi:hypothetical protein